MSSHYLFDESSHRAAWWLLVVCCVSLFSTLGSDGKVSGAKHVLNAVFPLTPRLKWFLFSYSLGFGIRLFKDWSFLYVATREIG